MEQGLSTIINSYFKSCTKVLTTDKEYIKVNGKKVSIHKLNLKVPKDLNIRKFKFYYENRSIRFSKLSTATNDSNLISRVYRCVIKTFLFAEDIQRKTEYYKFDEWLNKLGRNLFTAPVLANLKEESLVLILMHLHLKIPLSRGLELELLHSQAFNTVKAYDGAVRKPYFNLLVNILCYCNDYLVAYLFPTISTGLKSLIDSFNINHKWSEGQIQFAIKLLKIVTSKVQIESAVYLHSLHRILPSIKGNLVYLDNTDRMLNFQSKYGLSTSNITYLFIDSVKGREGQVEISLFTRFREQIVDYLCKGNFSVPIIYSETYQPKSRQPIDYSVTKLLPLLPISSIEKINTDAETVKTLKEELKESEYESKEVGTKLNKLKKKSSKKVYDKVKERETFVSSRIIQLKSLLQKANIKYTRAELGATVKVLRVGKKCKMFTFNLVDYVNLDYLGMSVEGVQEVSLKTPFAQSILYRKTGEIFSVDRPDGKKDAYKILDIW